MRRNTLAHGVRYRNPSDRSESLRVAPGEVYDDSAAWVAAAAADTDGQVVVVEYNDLTVQQLKDLLDERGTEYPSDAKKPDLVTLAEGQ